MSKYPLAISRLIEKYPKARISKINETVTDYEFGKYKTRIVYASFRRRCIWAYNNS
jgi:hypothetical protein